jgi:hypothetical protein
MNLKSGLKAVAVSAVVLFGLVLGMNDDRDKLPISNNDDSSAEGSGVTFTTFNNGHMYQNFFSPRLSLP